MVGKVYITGEIGSWEDQSKEIKGVELVDVIADVESQKDITSLDVFINSPGGLEETGTDIYNYFKSLSIPVRTIARGQCCSIATKIFLSGSIREFVTGVQFMIHNPWISIEGDSDHLAGVAKELKALESNLAKTYHEETGLSMASIAPLMRNETFLSEEHLIKFGFATGQYTGDAGNPDDHVQLRAVAFSKKLIQNNNKMADQTMTSEEVKNKFAGLESLLNKVVSKLTSKAKALVLQDANGVEIDFTDLATDAVPQVGDSAMVEGSPAEGSYLMPSLENSTVVFEGGVVSEIIPEDSGDDSEELASLKEENEQLKKQVETLTSTQASQKKEIDEALKAVATLKSEIGSAFNYDPESDPKKKKKENEPQARQLFKTEE